MQIDQYYEVLGLQLGASAAEVKQAYRKLAKLWHPDRFHHDPKQQVKAEQEFKKILKAYEILKDYNPNSLDVKASPEIHTKRSTSETHYQEGVIYAEKEQYQEAIAEFSQSIRLDPNFIQAYQYRGFIFSKLGYENRAEADLRKATELKLTHKSEDVSRTSESHSQPRYEPPKSNASSNSWESLNDPWQCTQNLTGHQGAVTSIAFSPDEKFFASSSEDKTIKLWQLNTQEAILTLKGHNASVCCLVFNPDGKTLISGSSDKTIRVWDLRKQTARILGNWTSRHSDDVLSLAVSPDGKNLVRGSADKTVKIWQLNKDKSPYTMTGYGADILSIAISYNGKFLVSGGLEKSLRVRSLETSKLIRSIQGNSGVLSVAISPDNTILATGGFDRTIKLWKLNTGEEIGTLIGHLDRVSCVIFSPDGKTVISGSWDKTIKLWKLDTQEEICTLNKHLDRVLSVVMTPNGKTIISGSSDKSIKVWQYGQVNP